MSAPAWSGLRCLHCRGSLGLVQYPPCPTATQHKSPRSWPTFPFRPIYPHTLSLEQEVRPVYQASLLCLPVAIAISRSKPASTSSCPSTAPSMTKLRLRKEAYIPRSHLRNANNRKDQAGIFSPKSTSAVEVFAHETYLDELQDTEIKRKSIKLLREFKQFKENTRNRSVKSARKS